MYDKIQDQARIANVRDVAQQRYFYDIPEEAIPPELEAKLDRQIIERALSPLEGNFNRVVSRVIDKATNRGLFRGVLDTLLLTHGKRITRREKSALSFFVALQFIRTREFRLTLKDGLEQFESVVRTLVPSDKLDEFFEGFRGVDDANVRMHSLSMMFDREFVRDLSQKIYRHILVLGINSSKHALYTSDNPMVRQAHKKHPVLRHVGVGSPGIEIAMPLSSHHILIFLEKSHFSKWAKWDRKAVHLKEEQVEYYNSLQVRGCERQLYCAYDDFDLAREFCQRWPERCAEERRRVVVE